MRWQSQRGLVGAVWLALAVALMVMSDGARLTALDGGARLIGRYDGGGPSYSAAAVNRLRAEAGEVARVAVWAQTVGERLEVEALKSGLNVDALWIDGPSQLVWALDSVRGSLPSFGGAHIVALSSDAALRLFGELDCVGQTVKLNGVELEVCCVFELPKGWSAPAADPGRAMALLPAALLKPDAKLDGLECSFLDGYGGDMRAALQGWLGSSGLQSPARILDAADSRDLSALLSAAPLLLLAAFTAWPLLAQALRSAARGISGFRTVRADRLAANGLAWRALAVGLLSGAGLLALAGAALLLPSAELRLPPAYIPTRWSDLSFWPGLIASALETLAQASLRGALRPDLVRDNLLTLSSQMALLSALCALLSRRALSQAGRPPDHWPVLLVSGCLSPPLALLLAIAAGYPAAAPPGLLLIPAAMAAAITLTNRPNFINQEVDP